MMDAEGYVYITILMVLFLVFTAAVSHGDTLIAWGRENSRYRRENAKLRGLAYKAWKAAEQLCLAFEGPCDGDCTHDKSCPLGEHQGCIYWQLRRELREAGIEVE